MANKYKKKEEKKAVSPEQQKARKPHRERKNPHARDIYAKTRKALNAARGPQIFVDGVYSRGMLEAVPL